MIPYQMRNRILLSLLASLILSWSAIASPSSVSALDLKGEKAYPFSNDSAKAIVFIFLDVECPIANRYAPLISRIYDRFSKEGVAFWSVYANDLTKIEEIKKHRKDFRLTLPALRDPKHNLVKLTEASVTPEAVVYVPSGDSSSESLRVVYRGRINDQYLNFGKWRHAPTVHDLQETLEAILKGEKLAFRSTRAVGCYIAN